MARVGLGAILTLLVILISGARAQDVASVSSRSEDGGALGPIVAIAAIATDARTEIVKQLEVRGYDPEGSSLDEALRAFAADHDLDAPDRAGWVTAVTLDALGAGRAVALRWAGSGPRAPELSPEERWRLNEALRLREYTLAPARTTIDEETLAALRLFQRETGHPVQESEVIERRWLFILGVASDESTEPPPPAAPPIPPGLPLSPHPSPR